jgi:hypothetical protein
MSYIVLRRSKRNGLRNCGRAEIRIRMQQRSSCLTRLVRCWMREIWGSICSAWIRSRQSGNRWMRKEGREKERKEGRKKWRKKGRKEGRKKWRKKGRKEESKEKRKEERKKERKKEKEEGTLARIRSRYFLSVSFVLFRCDWKFANVKSTEVTLNLRIPCKGRHSLVGFQ